MIRRLGLRPTWGGLRWTCIAGALIVLLVRFTAFAQPDDRWKEDNDMGNRWEGRADKLLASEVALVSLSMYWEQSGRFDIDTSWIRFFLQDTDEVKITLTAKELQSFELYWMEAKPWPLKEGWNEFGPWPSGKRQEYRVPESNVGITADVWGPPDYPNLAKAPVVVYQSPTDTTAKIGQYRAVFRPEIPISWARYRVLYGLTSDSVAVPWQWAGIQIETTPFPVLFKLDNHPEGWYRLVLDFKKLNEDSTKLDYYPFYHVPTLPALRPGKL